MNGEKCHLLGLRDFTDVKPLSQHATDAASPVEREVVDGSSQALSSSVLCLDTWRDLSLIMLHVVSSKHVHQETNKCMDPVAHQESEGTRMCVCVFFFSQVVRCLYGTEWPWVILGPLVSFGT